jgi:hypothetical protein
MESTGKAGAIQVTEETCQILQQFGYTFEQRGMVAVKGKGQLMTYYLQGKVARNVPSSPMLVNTMEPLPEVEEPKESPHHESPCPPTLSSATASPSSVRLNQNYNPNGDNSENLDNSQSDIKDELGPTEKDVCEEKETHPNGNIKNSENDPLLVENETPEKTVTEIVQPDPNHYSSDEKEALLERAK